MRLFGKLQPLAGNMKSAHIQGNITTSLMLGLEEVLTPANLGKIGDPDVTVCIVNPGPSARTEEALTELNAGVDENGRRKLIALVGSGYNMLNNGLKRVRTSLRNMYEPVA